MALIVTRNRVIICLLFLLSISPMANAPSVSAQPGATLPVLTSAVTSSIPTGLVYVGGQGFTPGGLVFIALYDQWGNALQETRWTVATTEFSYPNGTFDPASINRSGGDVSEVFELDRETTYGTNGSQDPARGYVAGTDQSLDRRTVFGPNGSQDPARGYNDGGSVTQMAGLACDEYLMVRAFDRQTATWSNLIDIDSGC